MAQTRTDSLHEGVASLTLHASCRWTHEINSFNLSSLVMTSLECLSSNVCIVLRVFAVVVLVHHWCKGEGGREGGREGGWVR